MTILSSFERIVRATAPTPPNPIPQRLSAFYWHFLRQVRGLIVSLVAIGFVVAVLDAALPAFFGRLVNLVASHPHGQEMIKAWPELAIMAIVVALVRPAALALQTMLVSQAMAPGLGNLIRWQSHWHVVRRDWAFFQNDFAGSVANRVVNTGPSLRETVVLTITAIWYIAVYGGSALSLLAASDLRLAMPVACWFVGYVLLLYHFVPRIRLRSREVSTVRSALTGRMVDSYSNIATVKLYSCEKAEDEYIRRAIDDHTFSYWRHLRLTTRLNVSISILSAGMIVTNAAVAVVLWAQSHIEIGVVAMTLPLSWQIANIAGWVAQNATALFENLGVVEDGMRAIATPKRLESNSHSGPLKVSKAEIRFENVRFAYDKARPVLKGVDLTIAPGEWIGLSGVSGSGKSTLVHLLLHLFELDGGRIVIDGQDIRQVSLESLWRQIAVVTQDISLLNRSIRDNLRLGRPEASDAELREMAARTNALDFITALEDSAGRRGLDTHVGDRGIKLSGGQRQRVAIARALLKNAPILVLDEATSALDDATEAAVQLQLLDLMKGRTVIAIAHRPSTIAHMDRLIRLENGRITAV